MGCITSDDRQTDQLTFHFAGMKRPKWYRTSALNLPDAALIITVSSSLTAHDTISNLKKLIRKTYKIPSDKNILILYSHTIISHDDTLTLQDCNLTNNCLLLIAINADTEHTLSCESPTETKANHYHYIDREASPQASPPPFHLFAAHLLRRANAQAEINLTEPQPPPRRLSHRRRLCRINLDLLPRNSMSDSSDESSDDDEFKSNPFINPTPHTPTTPSRFFTRRRSIRFHDEPVVPTTTAPPRLLIRNTSDFRSLPPPPPVVSRPPNSPLPSPPPARSSPLRMRSFHFEPPVPSQVILPGTSITNSLPPQPPPVVSRSPLPSPPPPARSSPLRVRSFHFEPPVPSQLRVPSTPLPLPSLTLTDAHNNAVMNTDSLPPTPITPDMSLVPSVVMNAVVEDMKTDSAMSLTSVSTANAVRLDDNVSVHSPSTFSSSSLDLNSDSTKPMKGFDIITQEEDVLVYKMPGCGHAMNRESLYEYALRVFMDHNNVYLKCPHSVDETNGIVVEDGYWSCARCTFINKNNASDCIMCGLAKQEKKLICDAKWEYSQIKKILAPDITATGAITIELGNKLAHKLAKLELWAARNTVENECNVQKCSRCETLYFREKDDSKWLGRKMTKEKLQTMFETKCVMCANYSFCWGCGVEYHDGHLCDSSFRSELVHILKEADTKKVGEVEDVPSIRCCPNCCQLINHSDACKHMKCKACKTDFCFICLKPKKDGNWQCGSHSDPCPVAHRQNEKTLPDSVVINKKAFKLSF